MNTKEDQTITIVIQHPSKAKPAGVMGRFGNIHQNKNGYHAWTDKAVRLVKLELINYQPAIFPLKPRAIIIQHYPQNFKCGDILNIAGATMDVLKKAGIIKDDSPNNVSRVVTDMLRVTDSQYNEPTIVITLCLTEESFKNFMVGSYLNG